MRTVEEIRSRYLENLNGAVRRPLMYGGNDFGVELYLSGLLWDLCYLDDRDAERHAAFEEMKRHQQFGCQGVLGVFQQAISEDGGFGSEVASVFAVIAHVLGYLAVDETLSPSKFERLRKELRTACYERDWTRDEVIERCGPPSLTIGGNLAYLSSDISKRWIHFDFETRSPAESETRCPLRDVRLPAMRFQQEFIFTPHGRRNGAQRWTVGATSFNDNGYALVPDILSHADCDTLAAKLPSVESRSGGTRTLLAHSWCRSLASQLREHPSLASLIPSDYVAVQCTGFEKSLSRNWSVPFHQDMSIPMYERVGRPPLHQGLNVPVAEQVDNPSLSGWSEKEGSLFVQPPTEVLERLVAVRLYLDDCGLDDGPLYVADGSHCRGKLDADQTKREPWPRYACTGERGTVLVMRPLLLHSSFKATGDSRRRVLHFLYGPRELPFGLRWQHFC